jgi:hypothetical protein
MKKNLLLFMQLCLLISALALSAKAQVPTQAPTVQLEEMKKLNFLLGEWRGDAWILIGQNQRETAKQTETVQSKLGGLALVIDGLGKTTDGKERIVHNALAVISYNPQKKGYRVSTYQANGVEIEAEAKVGHNALEWGFKTERGNIRFTIKLNEKGEWYEIGEFSPDGKSWFKMMEMTLQKVK